MNTDEKLAAILAAIQTDPGNRGLAELFAYCPGDFAAACRSLNSHPVRAGICVVTGFYIPSATPPAFETDGPLGAAFLARAFDPLGYRVEVLAEPPVQRAFESVHPRPDRDRDYYVGPKAFFIAIERGGPGADGRCRTMRGVDITRHLEELNALVAINQLEIGIGDGGNEIGMGKIPHDIVARNIPNGDLIHCRMPTDHLIVAGVSNWGAYALAAGIYVLKGIKPPADLFDPDREREILEVMVKEGPLVDGVTGQQTATVDGLTWDEYAKPLIRLREILLS